MWIDDHKTNKTWSVTLAELEAPENRPNFPTTYPELYPTNATYSANSKVGQLIKNKQDAENKYHQPSKSKINPWNTAVQKAGVGSELWRGTSESRWPSFKTWLEYRQSSDIIVP